MSELTVIPPTEVSALVKDQIEAVQALLESSNSGIIPNLDNCVRVLENDYFFGGRIWFDEFHQKVFTTWDKTNDKFKSCEPRQWEDSDDLRLNRILQQDYGFRRVGREIVAQAVRLYASQNIKNEVREWMDGLKWDGQSRIENGFTTMFGTDDTEYYRNACNNFWVGMVARTYQPGCQMDNMIVLEGPQGSFKSSALRAIGGKWYTECHVSVNDKKDFLLTLSGHLLIEIAELSSFTKGDLNQIKQIISNPRDNYRAPYAAHNATYPRRSVFVGTTNESVYLQDTTGARRFWPIECRKIDLPWIKDNREQLFAEAVDRYKNDFTWWTMPEAETLEIQESRRQEDPWESAIETYLIGKDQVMVQDIIVDCLKMPMERAQNHVGNRIGRILRKMGWIKRQARIEYGQNPRKFWVTPERLRGGYGWVTDDEN